MDTDGPDRLMEWFHDPRGFSLLLVVASVLFGVTFWLDYRGTTEPGLVGWLIAAGVGLMGLSAAVGVVSPDRFGGDDRDTWQVVLLLLVIGVLLVTIPTRQGIFAFL